MQYVKKLDDFKTNESVTPIGDKYLVNGISIPQRVVNAYSKKVKDQTGKDLKQIYSESQIAEELIKYVVDKFLDVETLPVSALIGGDEEIVPEEPTTPLTEEPTDTIETDVEATVETEPEVSGEEVTADVETTETPTETESEDEFEKPTAEDELPL